MIFTHYFLTFHQFVLIYDVFIKVQLYYPDQVCFELPTKLFQSQLRNIKIDRNMVHYWRNV